MTESTGFLDRFAELERRLAAEGPDWLRAIRARGTERFREVGLPTPGQEEWRDTRLGPLTSTTFSPAETPATPSGSAELPAVGRLAHAGPRLVFVDGRFDAAASSAAGDVPGLWVGTLQRALDEIPDRVRPLLEERTETAGVAFESLNDALFREGALVLAEDGATAEAPVRIDWLSGHAAEPTATHPRTLIAAGRGARLRVVETYLGVAPAVYFTNAVTTAVGGDDAEIDHIRIQQESEEAYHISTLRSSLARDGRYRLHAIDLGGKLVRNHLTARMGGAGAHCLLKGLYLTRHRQHLDNHTVLDHAEPHCDSRELFKGILDGKSRTVFSGRIVVRQDAQKTDAKQSNPNLLLSPDALAQTRPQLEIYADDVKCTHGATVGQMDEDAIFYLRSRGIDRTAARHLLIRAFAGEILETIESEPLRETLEREVAARLPRDA